MKFEWSKYEYGKTLNEKSYNDGKRKGDSFNRPCGHNIILRNYLYAFVQRVLLFP